MTIPVPGQLERLRQVVGDKQIEGIQSDRLSGLLTGWQLPTSLECALIAEATGVTVLWLLEGRDEQAVDEIHDEALLLKGIAERHTPPLTLDQARDRLERGGDAYRKFLERGYEAFREAIEADRDAVVDHAKMLEALERHQVTQPMIRIAIDYWSDNYNRESDAAWDDPNGGNRRTAAHYARMGVYEYAWPGNQDEILRMVRP